MKFSALLTLLIATTAVRCYKILLVFPLPAPSHFILGSALAKGLAEAGHDVTIIGRYRIENPPNNGKKIREIIISHDLEAFAAAQPVNLFKMGTTNPLSTVFFISKMGGILTKVIMSHPKIQHLVSTKEKFDVMILEQFMNEAFRGLASEFNAHVILFSPISANNLINPFVGNPSPPSYIPWKYLGYTSNMSFKQRLINSLVYVVEVLEQHLLNYPRQAKIVKELLSNPPDFDSILYNVSLVLLNAHESVNQAVPYVPNMINIGGFHVQPPKALPEDLQKFLDDAKDGVVYFSLGSNIKPSNMPNETKAVIINALGKLKQKVLWKWDEDTIINQPGNVKLSKWFPQQDLLAHPNIKLFITHGGLLSTIETVYHGVPILALPILSDQKMNAANAENDGYCINLPFTKINEENLSKALREILDNPQYRDNVKTRSELMHDRPLKPMDWAVYWVEFVIRHNGAPHLRVAGVKLPWYQYLLLDVVAFLFITPTLLILLIYKLIRIYRSRKRSPKLKTH